ncbi:MAG: ABC transporter permease [Pseudomonadaceae bacterium]|nr:ABC transporter permease [Pseudomonadaceae bacterium]
MTMSPINARRIANFRANRRALWSLRIFLVLFVITLCAEMIANDRPIFMVLKGKLFVPMLIDYSETELGGVLPSAADYRDPFVADLISEGLVLWPLIRYSHNTINWDVELPLPHPPDGEHWLGTDSSGNDVLAKLIYGFRLSVLFGLSMTVLASFIGITVGALQGYFGGLTDLIGQRMVEIWTGLPVLFVLIILNSIVEPTFFWMLVTLTLFSWMALTGVVRAEFLRARNFEFVRAARAMGVGNLTIMLRHVLPNAMTAALTYTPFLLNSSIATLTALDFLNLGLPLDYPSLGRLLTQAQANLQAPWLGLSVFATLATMLTLLIFVGEGVRDAFDPRRTIGSTRHD